MERTGVASLSNKAMARKLESGDAIDLSGCDRTPEGHYVIPREMEAKIEDADLCDAKEEAWIWSVGRRNTDKVVLASTTPIFYQNPDFECLWLR